MLALLFFGAVAQTKEAQDENESIAGDGDGGV
jgi:hypothetical protein